MEKQELKKALELHDNDRISIFTSDAKIITAGNNGVFLVWDDNNELLHVIRTNTSHYNQMKEPVDIQTLAYSTIEFISTSMNLTKLEEFLTKVNSSKKKEILEYFSKLY